MFTTVVEEVTELKAVCTSVEEQLAALITCASASKRGLDRSMNNSHFTCTVMNRSFPGKTRFSHKVWLRRDLIVHARKSIAWVAKNNIPDVQLSTRQHAEKPTYFLHDPTLHQALYTEIEFRKGDDGEDPMLRNLRGPADRPCSPRLSIN
jgi:hypothetical protein